MRTMAFSKLKEAKHMDMETDTDTGPSDSEDDMSDDEDTATPGGTQVPTPQRHRTHL